jgi:hypothetical protein
MTEDEYWNERRQEQDYRDQLDVENARKGPCVLMLIGCSQGKSRYVRDPKRGGRLTPAELYSSQLFRSRVKHAEARGLEWAVLSAEMGLWFHSTEKSPLDCGGEVYNKVITELTPADRAAWNTSVAHKVVEWLWEPYETGVGEVLRPADVLVEIHAGKEYSTTLAVILNAVGFTVVRPTQGMMIGQQLQYYADRRKAESVKIP